MSKMEDPMLSAIDFDSMVGELSEIIPVGDCPTKKQSPGHASNFSYDSGFAMGSPTQSEISQGDPDSFSEFDMNLTFDDLMTEEDNTKDLSSFLPVVDCGVEEAQHSETAAPAITNTCSPELSRANTMDVEELCLADTMTDDLEKLLSQVESCENTQQPVAEEEAPPQTGSGRPRRSLRATRGGKTVNLESELPRKSSRPVTRRRAATKPSDSPQSSVSDVDLEDLSTVDKSQKNALQARINRQKKKAYIEGLESQVGDLTKENGQLKKDTVRFQKELESLEEEVAYLRNVIANQSALAGMLQNIGNVGGVRLTTSFSASRKRSSSELDHDYTTTAAAAAPASKRRKEARSKVSGGVCLHVDNGSASLELCSTCARMAKGGPREDV